MVDLLRLQNAQFSKSNYSCGENVCLVAVLISFLKSERMEKTTSLFWPPFLWIQAALIMYPAQYSATWPHLCPHYTQLQALSFSHSIVSLIYIPPLLFPRSPPHLLNPYQPAVSYNSWTTPPRLCVSLNSLPHNPTSPPPVFSLNILWPCFIIIRSISPSHTATSSVSHPLLSTPSSLHIGVNSGDIPPRHFQMVTFTITDCVNLPHRYICGLFELFNHFEYCFLLSNTVCF